VATNVSISFVEQKLKTEILCDNNNFRSVFLTAKTPLVTALFLADKRKFLGDNHQFVVLILLLFVSACICINIF